MARKKAGPTRKRSDALAARKCRAAGNEHMEQFYAALENRNAEAERDRENALKRQWAAANDRPPDYVVMEIMAVDDEPVITRTERRIARKLEDKACD
jgi:hypothetical protein